MGVTASAPAKTILLGEHFVVYGEPAIVVAINKRVKATVDFREDKRIYFHSSTLNLSGSFEGGKFSIEDGDISEARSKFDPLRFAVEKVLETYGQKVGLNFHIASSVPVSAGLGSSAAVATAVITAADSLLNLKMSKQEIFHISYETEKIVHGNPSGIDPAISTFGGTMLFQKDAGFQPIDVKADVPLIVGYTGVNRSTGVQIAKVKDLKERYPQIIQPMLNSGRQIVLTALDALKKGRLKILGDLMNINHALLYGLGVSHESLELLINEARKNGALGAKLTGGGGGGCMIALAEDDKLPSVLEALRRIGGRPFVAKKTDEGVRIEKK